MRSSVIAVPNGVSLRNAPDFLQLATWDLSRDTTVEISFQPGSGQIDPWVFAAIGAYISRANRWDMTVDATGLVDCAEAARMGIARFIESPNGSVEDSESEPVGRYIPMRWVSTSQDLAVVFADVVPLLHLADAPEQAKAIQYSVSEMVRNVMEHSRSDDGAIVAAELYSDPDDGPARVSIAVADGGMGIRSSIERNYDVASDADGILTAVKPGTTGAARGRYGATENAGAGLFFTRRMARTTGGHFAVLSGEALFVSPPEADGDSDEALLATVAPYPGTVIAIEVGTEARFDLTEFLAGTGEAFHARSDRASRRSQRARFT
jgi:hypothetical protein